LRNEVSKADSSMNAHVVPVKVYVTVFATLLVMTATTTAISGIDLGPWNTVVALGIAVFKASLVVLFFMHAKYSPRLTNMVILAGIFWLALLLLITFSDFASRGWLQIT
jgi:cytochrome c oxidase subunit IV